VQAPTTGELCDLSHEIASRVGLALEREGLLERDAQAAWLSEAAGSAGPLDELQARSITYRIAVGPNAGCKVMTLQSLPAAQEDDNESAVGQMAGFSLHAVVAARAHERGKL
jgi:hypothetical protein